MEHDRELARDDVLIGPEDVGPVMTRAQEVAALEAELINAAARCRWHECFPADRIHDGGSTHGAMADDLSGQVHEMAGSEESVRSAFYKAWSLAYDLVSADPKLLALSRKDDEKALRDAYLRISRGERPKL